MVFLGITDTKKLLVLPWYQQNIKPLYSTPF